MLKAQTTSIKLLGVASFSSSAGAFFDIGKTRVANTCQNTDIDDRWEVLLTTGEGKEH